MEYYGRSRKMSWMKLIGYQYLQYIVYLLDVGVQSYCDVLFYLFYYVEKMLFIDISINIIFSKLNKI